MSQFYGHDTVFTSIQFYCIKKSLHLTFLKLYPNSKVAQTKQYSQKLPNFTPNLLWIIETYRFRLRYLVIQMIQFSHYQNKQESQLASCRAGFHVISWKPYGVHVVCMWKPCGVHVEMMWCPCGNHVVLTCELHSVNIETTWYPHGNHLVFTWIAHGAHVECYVYIETTQCSCGNHVVSTWKPCGYPHGNHVVSTWIGCGVHMVAMLCPHRNHMVSM